jgi:hypothetical protein
MTEGRDPERRGGSGTEDEGVSNESPHGGIGGQGGEGEGGTPPIGDVASTGRRRRPRRRTTRRRSSG